MAHQLKTVVAAHVIAANREEARVFHRKREHEPMRKLKSSSLAPPPSPMPVGDDFTGNLPDPRMG